MLKTIGSTKFVANLKETKGKATSNSVVGNRVFGSSEITNQISLTKKKPGEND